MVMPNSFSMACYLMPGMAAIVTILAPGASWTVAVTLSFCRQAAAFSILATLIFGHVQAILYNARSATTWLHGCVCRKACMCACIRNVVPCDLLALTISKRQFARLA